MTVCIRQKLYRELSKVAQPLTQCIHQQRKPLSIQNLFLITEESDTVSVKREPQIQDLFQKMQTEQRWANSFLKTEYEYE